MPDAATLAVLRDVATFVVIAFVLGFAAYGLAGRRFAWLGRPPEGRVLFRHFGLPDAVFAALLLFILIGGLLTSDSGQGQQQSVSSASPESQQFGQVLVQIMFVLMEGFLIVLWLRLVRQFDLVEMFGLRRLRPRQIFVTAVFWIVPSMIVVNLSHALISEAFQGVWSMDDPQDLVKLFESTTSIPTRIGMVVAASICAPLVEELIFRGVIYGVCKRFTDAWFSALVSALLFATVHLHVGSFVPLFVLALALVAAYEYTGSLMVPVAMHAIFNSVMLVSMML